MIWAPIMFLGKYYHYTHIIYQHLSEGLIQILNQERQCWIQVVYLLTIEPHPTPQIYGEMLVN